MMLGLEHLTDAERSIRERQLDACVCAAATPACTCDIRDAHTIALWRAICQRTKDWGERLALIDAHTCVVISLGEMMVSKGVFGQRHLENAASLLSEFLVFDRTEDPTQRTSRARLIRDRLADISLGAGEARALRLLAIRIDLELELLGEAS